MHHNNAAAAEGGAAQKFTNNGMYNASDAAMEGPAPHQGQSNSYAVIGGQNGIPASIMPILNGNPAVAGPGTIMY
jgi:hypothetical protein